MATKQLPLNTVLNAIDRKDRDFFDRLSVEEQKMFSPFLMLRYASSVQGDADMQHYYLASTNHYANRGMFDKPISEHKKFQWLMFTAISPGLGTMRHNWIKQKKKDPSDILRILLEMYPAMKESDAEVLSHFVTKKELKNYAKDSGEK